MYNWVNNKNKWKCVNTHTQLTHICICIQLVMQMISNLHYEKNVKNIEMGIKKMRCVGLICSEVRETWASHTESKWPSHPDHGLPICGWPALLSLLLYGCLWAARFPGKPAFRFWGEMTAPIRSKVWLVEILYFSLVRLVENDTVESFNPEKESGCEVCMVCENLAATS